MIDDDDDDTVTRAVVTHHHPSGPHRKYSADRDDVDITRDTTSLDRKSKDKFGRGREELFGSVPEPEMKEARVDLREHEREQGGDFHVYYLNVAAVVINTRGIIVAVTTEMLLLVTLYSIELFVVLR